MFIVSCQAEENLLFWVRQIDAVALLLPFGFFLLHVIILEPEITFPQLCFRLRYLLSAAFFTALLCQTDFFLRATYFASPEETIPIADYGPGFLIYIGYFVLAAIAMILSVPKVIYNTSGVQRTESQFLIFGWLFGFSFGVILFTVANTTGMQEATRFLPLFPLVMNSFVAYGIATRRILAVSLVVQRVVSVLLMTIYLCILYILVERIVRAGFTYLLSDPTYVSHLISAVITALSVVPAHGWMQTAAHRLFASAHLLDVDRVLHRAGHIFQEVLAESELMDRFAGLVQEAFGCRELRLLRRNGDDPYRLFYSLESEADDSSISPASPLVTLLCDEHEPFTQDTLERMRPTPTVLGARREMKTLNAAVAMGLFLRNECKAVLLLGPKKSGRIYDLRDQHTLQMLCDQLVVALENANLYTAVQNSKIYNDILLDSLTSGIIAVDADQTVTVFNKRARQLTGLSEAEVLNRAMTRLPPILVEGLDHALQTGEGFRDRDGTIRLNGEDVPVRVSAAMFHGHTGRPLGALLVFNDMTQLKKMEEQIRRTDRLASIGTLSAGMAHEIKNPLVTIKTFTQLLPQQYAESDFRETFFDLVGQEVKRIDTIVNRLLNFARPAKAALVPVSLHQTVENSLRLVEQQLVQKGIHLDTRLEAEHHMIEADAEQLNQMFVNFFLNAIQAMEPGGTLSVISSPVASALSPLDGQQNGPMIQLDIRDTGCGIPPGELDHIFDPFFTNKENGVGLGLSVSHGIIQEHNGSIDVESEPGTGTIFHIQFPLLREKQRTVS